MQPLASRYGARRASTAGSAKGAQTPAAAAASWRAYASPHRLERGTIGARPRASCAAVQPGRRSMVRLRKTNCAAVSTATSDAHSRVRMVVCVRTTSCARSTAPLATKRSEPRRRRAPRRR
ncbi:hypothetical protein AB1Y20_011062 [Prymnesium parvum]|uniref:Uncharacterized protein n=1 Tax=Prymnesium parvum TaxID=97485 RepID=A0AB34ILH1_PRYPA